MCDYNMHREANLMLIHLARTAVSQKLRAGVVGSAAAAIYMAAGFKSCSLSTCLHWVAILTAVWT